MRARHASLLAVVASTLAWGSSVARADEAHDRATARVKEGAQKYVDHDYAGALALFQDGYRAYPSPRIEFDIAQCLHRLDRFEEAATTYQAYLDDAVNDPSLDSVSKGTARSSLEELESKVFRVAVATTPEGAQVKIDGKLVTGGRAFVLRKEPHILEVAAPGYEVRTQTLSEPASGPLRVAVMLSPLPAAATTLAEPGPPSPLPDAGPDLRTTSTSPAEVPAAGGLAATAPAPPPSPSHTASWVVWGIGAALAAGGAISGVLAIESSNDITSRHHRCPSGAPDDPSCGPWLTEAELANSLFGGAAAAGVVGGVLWLTAGPGAAPRSAQAGVSGTF